MTDEIVTVENLGKKYAIRHQAERYTALRDVITEKATVFFKRLKSRKSENLRSENGDGNSRVSVSQPFSVSRTSKEDFWALKNVSFEVRRGEVLGIIGRNGAGKTTLLKILSRITEPTEGRVRIKGRVASLLEVGTGFHPELTGRENIYLNGAILGMSKAEIKKKFHEIVAFAETERFLDTPVKRYSSGMYVRLAFAVAAHLEPEILIVDEVLAVGDAQFQKKCLGKMQDVAANEGRTVLFVSHNMAAISSLTAHGIVLVCGRLAFDGSSSEAVKFYTNSLKDDRVGGDRYAGRGEHTKVKQVRFVDENGLPTGHYMPGRDLILEVEFETSGRPSISIEVFLLNSMRSNIALASLYQLQGLTLPQTAGTYVCRFVFQPLWLASGRYSFDVTTSVVNHNWDHYVEDAVTFEVVASNPLGLPWDFRQQYGYGDIAMLCSTQPGFSQIDWRD